MVTKNIFWARQIQIKKRFFEQDFCPKLYLLKFDFKFVKKSDQSKVTYGLYKLKYFNDLKLFVYFNYFTYFGSLGFLVFFFCLFCFHKVTSLDFAV